MLCRSADSLVNHPGKSGVDGGGAASAADAPVRAADAGAAGRGAGDGLKRPPRPPAPHRTMLFPHGPSAVRQCLGGSHV